MRAPQNPRLYRKDPFKNDLDEYTELKDEQEKLAEEVQDLEDMPGKSFLEDPTLQEGLYKKYDELDKVSEEVEKKQDKLYQWDSDSVAKYLKKGARGKRVRKALMVNIYPDQGKERPKILDDKSDEGDGYQDETWITTDREGNLIDLQTGYGFHKRGDYLLKGTIQQRVGDRPTFEEFLKAEPRDAHLYSRSPRRVRKSREERIDNYIKEYNTLSDKDVYRALNHASDFEREVAAILTLKERGLGPKGGIHTFSRRKNWLDAYSTDKNNEFNDDMDEYLKRRKDKRSSIGRIV